MFRAASKNSKNAFRRLQTRSISMEPPFLLTPSQLMDLSPKKTSVLDTTWLMPNSKRDASQEFLERHIPGSQFLDLDKVASSHELGLPHMMPTPKTFSEACTQLQIKPDDHVVLYDTQGIFSAPRALFMFKAFGHKNASVLDGGLPRWQAAGLLTESGLPKRDATAQNACYPLPALDGAMIRSYKQVVSNADLDPSQSSAELVLDARSAGRFTGKDPEPRPGLSSGHIPHSLSLPFSSLVTTQTSPNGKFTYTTLLAPDDLRKTIVSTIGEDNFEKVMHNEKSVTATCGSGMTAGVIWLALQVLGARQVAIYDESWMGYAQRAESNIAKD